MATIQASVSAEINAPPEKVYRVIADYDNHHPHILPRPYFTGLEVLEGGQGAGTLVAVEMNVMGVRAAYRLRTAEPQPGRVLVERDDDTGVVTTFTVEPLAGGERSRLTIETESRASPGLRGFLERRPNPGIMRRIYRAELAQLAVYVRSLD